MFNNIRDSYHYLPITIQELTLTTIQKKVRKRKNIKKKKPVQAFGSQDAYSCQPPVRHNKWAKQRAEIDAIVSSTKQTQARQAPLTSYTTQRFASTHSSESYSLTSATDASTSDNNLLGLDCEYVGVGYEGQDDCLARVSIVNATGECIYDKYVKPGEEVVDYRTEVSGIRPGMLKNGEGHTRASK